MYSEEKSKSREWTPSEKLKSLENAVHKEHVKLKNYDLVQINTKC